MTELTDYELSSWSSSPFDAYYLISCPRGIFPCTNNHTRCTQCSHSMAQHLSTFVHSHGTTKRSSIVRTPRLINMGLLRLRHPTSLRLIVARLTAPRVPSWA